MKNKRLFGTDGIRGQADAFPLDRDTVAKTGWALARVLQRPGRATRVLIGRDTRESGGAIEEALTRALAASGVSVTGGGILSTPAVAFLAKDGAFDAGIVISASHNPYHDNGIKIFSRDGFKVPDEVERQVETLVLDDDGGDAPVLDRAATVQASASNPLLRTRYLAHLREVLPADFSLDGTRILIDCANGSASALAPETFRRLGAEVTAVGCEPDGRNINAGCGALHAESLVGEVQAKGYALGIAYDGDADRCILVDEKGTVRDGDDILAVAATAMRDAGTLRGATVVSTVMANLGLEKYIRSLRLDFVRTAVGDKYVLEEMVRRGAILGGEQSGHVIFLEHATTGDGLLTSLRVAHTMVATGKTLAELASVWTRLPQVLKSVRVRERVDLQTIPAIASRLADAEATLSGRGRLLVRYSGTEPVVRIMLEGEEQRRIDDIATDLAAAVTRALG